MIIENNDCFINELNNDLQEDIRNIEQIYNSYKTDESNNIKYIYLKQAIYNLSLTIKRMLVEGTITEKKAQELNSYYWGLLC